MFVREIRRDRSSAAEASVEWRSKPSGKRGEAEGRETKGRWGDRWNRLKLINDGVASRRLHPATMCLGQAISEHGGRKAGTMERYNGRPSTKGVADL